jgi:hypothetical protein
LRRSQPAQGTDPAFRTYGPVAGPEKFIKSMSISRFIWAITGFLGTRAAGATAGFLAQLLLARLFSPADVGITSLTMSLAAFASIIVTWGYSALALTSLARFHSLGSRCLVRAFLAVVRRDTMLGLLVMFGIVVLATQILPLQGGYRTAIFFGSLATPAFALIRLNYAAANAVRRFWLSYGPDFVFRPLLLLMFIVAMFFFVPGFGITPVLWGFVAIAWAVAIGQAGLLG